MRSSSFLLALVLVFATACAPQHQTQGRPWSVQSPKDATEPLPLVVLLHGYAAAGWAQDVVFPFSQQVEAKRFHYAKLEGTLDQKGHRFWNGTDYCCDFANTGVDDVAYVQAAIADIKQAVAVKEGHVFLVGHSNGAFLALRIACEAGGAVNGITAVSGATWLEEGHCPSGTTTPLLLVHGTADGTIQYDGLEGKYPGARETARRFAVRNGCDAAFDESATADFVGDATEETKEARWKHCLDARGMTSTSDDALLELWSVQDAGHVPPFDSRWTGAVIDWLEARAR